jgi:hypothetical protein
MIPLMTTTISVEPDTETSQSFVIKWRKLPVKAERNWVTSCYKSTLRTAVLSRRMNTSSWSKRLQITKQATQGRTWFCINSAIIQTLLMPWLYHWVTLKNTKILGFLSTATKPSKRVWLSWQLFPGQRGQLAAQQTAGHRQQATATAWITSTWRIPNTWPRTVHWEWFIALSEPVFNCGT